MTWIHSSAHNDNASFFLWSMHVACTAVSCNLRRTFPFPSTGPRFQVAPDPYFGARIAEGSALALQQSLIDQRLAFNSGPLGLG